MNSTFILLKVTRLAAFIVLASGPSLQVTAGPGSNPFSRVIVLGDSLSDTGNFHALSDGHPPSPPYADGRFSNGPLWIEYLVSALGMELLQEDNYAVGGSTTGTLNSNNGIAGLTYPAVQQQLAALLADHPTGLDPDALYVFWAGANDFFVALSPGGDPGSLIPNGVANTAAVLQTLWTAGARHILVVTVFQMHPPEQWECRPQPFR